MRARRVLALAATALLLLGCGAGIDREVERAVVRARDGGPVVDLAAVVDGGWDRVGLFGPYTTAEVIEETLGVAAPALAEGRLAADEGVGLLLFARDERVVAAAWLDRAAADLAGLSPLAVPRAEARFAVRPAAGGQPPALEPAPR